MLELYHSGQTTCSKQVRHCLREKNIPYESRWVELWRYENLSPAYLKINPNGVVPTLVHDGVPIINSFCINEYIEDTFPERPLRPAAPVRRARMRYWTWTADDIHIATGRISHANMLQDAAVKMSKEDREFMVAATPVPEKRYRWRRLVTGGWSEEEMQIALDSCAYCLEKMEEELSHGGDFIVEGDDITLADISMLAIVHRIRELYPTMLDPAKLPLVNAWHDRLKARPAVDFVYNAQPGEVPKRPTFKSIAGIKEFQLAE